MNVLSVFDGIGTGMLALKRANIKVSKYYSSEIDPYCIKINKKNFPEIIQLGNVEDWKSWNLKNIDMIIGGSPCQGFSKVGNQLNFEDPRSKLFFVFRDIINFYNPKYWMLENVEMKKEWMDFISKEMGVSPVIINSSLVSAQNRKRAYWSNFKFSLPKDKKIYLSEILLEKAEKKFWLSKKEKDYMDRETSDGRNHWDFSHHSDTENEKSSCVVSNFYKGVPYNVLIDQRKSYCSFWSCDFQQIDLEFCKMCVDEDGNKNDYQGENYPTSAVRKFHPIECERLQTLPDNYTEGVSNTQRYKMIGNGWTTDVVAHIFSHLPKEYKI